MTQPVAQNASPNTWWGTVTVAENRPVSFQIGPLQSWIGRSRLEWNIARRYLNDDEDDDSFAYHDLAPDEPPETADRQRFPFRETSPHLHLKPALADLPVVVRPDVELFLPSGEEARLFVTTPLWLVLAVGAKEIALADLPIRRPSETWFGPSTREGEVCYASRSRAKLVLSEVPSSCVRAITAVRVRNLAPGPFAINRIKVPAPQLSLHLSEDGRLWTETLSIERTDDERTVTFEIGSALPPEVDQAKRIGHPRRVAERHDLLQSIGAFLRGQSS